MPCHIELTQISPSPPLKPLPPGEGEEADIPGRLSVNKIKASVIGASGYGGAEAVRLLTTHPQVEIVHLTAETQQGQVMSKLYPNLRSFVDQTMIAVDAERIGRDSDVTQSCRRDRPPHCQPAAAQPGG